MRRSLRVKLPAGTELARFELLADNFIVESPPQVVAPPAIEAGKQTGSPQPEAKARLKSETDGQKETEPQSKAEAGKE